MDQELIAYLDRRFDQQDRSIAELRQEFRESHRHTQVVVEGLRSDIQTVAEGVTAVDQKLERFRQTIDRRLEETQAMVQAGFKTLRRKDTELDRRVTRLEAAQPRPAAG